MATAADVAAFLDALFDGRLLNPDDLARMTDCMKCSTSITRGLGIVRYDFGAGPPAFGHTGGTPGFATVDMRTTAGRCVVIWQNGLDAHDQLGSDDGFVQAALRV